MKKLLNRILPIILISQGSVCYSQSIEYIPIGPVDKPMPTFFFSYKNKVLRKKQKEFFIYEYKLSKEKFDSLCKNISTSLLKTNTLNTEDSLLYNYGAYKVIVKRENDADVFILNNKELSYRFFENQLIFFKDNVPVTEVILDSLLKRLK